MTYTPDPTNINQPNSGISAGTANSEFMTLKAYMQSFLGGRNLLFNGDFSVNQITSGSEVATPSLAVKYADGWFINNSSSSGNVTFTSPVGLTSQGLAGGTGLEVVFDASATTANFGQRIEAKRCQGLASGATVTISGYCQVDSLSGSPTLGYNLYVSTGAANSFGGLTSIASGTFTTTLIASAFALFEATVVLSGSGLNGCLLNFLISNGTSRTFYFTKLQLEVNNFATPFEQKSYTQNFIECQRYYQLGQRQFIVQGASVTADSNYFQFTAPMAVTPTVTLSNVTTPGVTGTTSNTDQVSVNGFRGNLTFSGTPAPNLLFSYNWTATTIF